jgi:hypothetical protein
VPGASLRTPIRQGAFAPQNPRRLPPAHPPAVKNRSHPNRGSHPGSVAREGQERLAEHRNPAGAGGAPPVADVRSTPGSAPGNSSQAAPSTVCFGLGTEAQPGATPALAICRTPGRPVLSALWNDLECLAVVADRHGQMRETAPVRELSGSARDVRNVARKLSNSSSRTETVARWRAKRRTRRRLGWGNALGVRSA